MPFPYQPYRTIPRPRNPKRLALTGVSVYPLSVPYQSTTRKSNGGYGSFKKLTTQIVPDVETEIEFPITVVSSGVSSNGSQLQVSVAGKYRVSTYYCINHESAYPESPIYSYIKTGSPSNPIVVPNSAMSVIQQNTEPRRILSDENIVQLNAGDVIICCLKSTDGHSFIYSYDFTAITPVPVIPSASVIVELIG